MLFRVELVFLVLFPPVKNLISVKQRLSAVFFAQLDSSDSFRVELILILFFIKIKGDPPSSSLWDEQKWKNSSWENVENEGFVRFLRGQSTIEMRIKERTESFSRRARGTKMKRQ